MNTPRLAGAFYVLTILSGTLALFAVGSWQGTANAVAGASYVVVTLLFYRLFAPVNTAVSGLAAAVSLVGCLVPVASELGLLQGAVNPLPVFGIYCVLIGWLILRATMPRLLGVLMVIGGMGWLTFASATMTSALAPYNFAPGILGESLLTLWLLVKGRSPARRGHTDAAAASQAARS